MYVSAPDPLLPARKAIAVAVDCAKSARKLDQQTHTIIISSGDRRPAFTDSANVTAASLMSAPKTPFAKAFDRGINWALGDEDGVDASVTNSTFRLDLPSPSDNVCHSCLFGFCVFACLGACVSDCDENSRPEIPRCLCAMRYR